MKWLKVAKYEPTIAKSGYVKKGGQSKKQFADAYRKHAPAVNSIMADFSIGHLAFQIIEECIFPTGKKKDPNGGGKIDDPERYGDANESEKSYCITLVTRIEDMVSSADLAPVLQPGSELTVSRVLADFFSDPNATILRISLKHLSFNHSTREIVANAIGRHLLALARAEAFKTQPVVVFLDEAHQFLDKQLGDENSRFPLDAFDLIAKEGRKYGLTICIATQRPRDIPEGVLSQMGTLVVHRLINDRDREVVERASGEIDRSAAEFLPTLAPGQAVIIGVDFPIPLTVQITTPFARPDSRGPDFQRHWSSPPETEQAIGAGQPFKSDEL